ncbi:unnamed protein product [Onchocerca ochengi]|uniref:SCP domain-containing protein n=1 Tax=Onchocerca ochengi TaxID=42157 RepID=A0A182E0E7_ONCOC|nr:unnamed protein product [Onchocerca ochengi]
MQNIISWKQHCRLSTPHSLAALFILFLAIASKAVTEGQNHGIQNKLFDETEFSNPKSFDYNFEDDFKKLADRNDIYDELVPYLPTFILHKNGKNAGRTSVPIITRKMPAWSTPLPRQKYVEPYKLFDKFSFEQPDIRRTTTPVTKKPVNQRLTTRHRSTTTATTTKRTTTKSINLLQEKQQQEKQRQQQQEQQRQRQRQRQQEQQQRQKERQKQQEQQRQQQRQRQQQQQQQQQQQRQQQQLQQQQQRQEKRRQQQHQQNIGLSDFARRLSESRSSLDAAIIKSQLVEQFNDKKSVKNDNTIRSIQTHVSAKPLIIHTGNGPYLGPTFNCKVLTPENDGRPSSVNDETCILKQPGVSADGKCRCTYVVSDRDSNGCALGFLFTCLPK